MKAIAEKAARDLAMEREHNAQTVATMQSSFAVQEAGWEEDRWGMETKINDQYALMRIWREVIADLRMRLGMTQMWIWGFRRYLDACHRSADGVRGAD